jgi:hypothetical protein
MVDFENVFGVNSLEGAPTIHSIHCVRSPSLFWGRMCLAAFLAGVELTEAKVNCARYLIERPDSSIRDVICFPDRHRECAGGGETLDDRGRPGGDFADRKFSRCLVAATVLSKLAV